MAREVEDRTAKMDLKNRANGSLARLSPLISGGGVNNLRKASAGASAFVFSACALESLEAE